MRRVFLSFLTSLVIYAIFGYMLTNLPLFDEGKIETYRRTHELYTAEEFNAHFYQLRDTGGISEIVIMGNVSAMLVILFLFVLSTFATIHLLVDKLFFKKFYQDPEWFAAYRRSVLVGSIVVWFCIFVIWGMWDVLMISITLVLHIGLEFVYLQYIKPRHEVEDQLDSLSNVTNSKLPAQTPV